MNLEAIRCSYAEQRVAEQHGKQDIGIKNGDYHRDSCGFSDRSEGN